MNSIGLWVALLLVSGLCLSAGPVSADSNLYVIIQTTESDGSGGCLLTVTERGGDTINIALGSEVNDCSLLDAGDCVFASGAVVNGLLTPGFSIGTYQFASNVWLELPVRFCE